MSFKKEKPLEGKDIHVGCLNCSSAANKAPMDMMIAVGFGMATVTKDGKEIYDGERDYSDTGNAKTVQDFEDIAKRHPNHDWRVIKNGPMHGETFQRQGDDNWVCIESNQGFA